MTDVDGTPFGRYRLIELIGEGGMGKVYKAHDTELDRDVAIKVLTAELGTEPGYRQRFRREAQAAARLTEPHIISIHDAGEIDGQLYLVMPIIDGIDLDTVLATDGPMNPSRAVSVTEQLAAALGAAHAIGLVHRDVKPSNALMANDDHVYLIDFGIAHDAKATKMTQTGSFLGTFAYMSPERLNAGAADSRSDVYALACVLYECLTGAQPFPGNTMQQVAVGHLTVEPPKPSTINPSVPKGFDEVIAIGMAKDPDERFQSARELATAARRALNDTPNPAHTTKPSAAPTRQHPPTAHHDQGAPRQPAGLATPQGTATASKRKWWIAAAVLLLVAVVGAAVVLRNVFSSNPTGGELVLSMATDPGENSFMPPVATPPPSNTEPPPTLQPQGDGGKVETQPLPGGREGLYGGTINSAELDREKLITFLGANPAQASAFVDALNTDTTIYWSGGHPLTVADIPTYLRELTPAVLRLDTRITNHGFAGNRFTTIQSVFQAGTAVLIDAHGFPRARGYSGNPLTAPITLAGPPKIVGAQWPSFRPGALAAILPSTAAITNFVLIDIITGHPFNRPVGTTGTNDTAHSQALPPPGSASAAPTTQKESAPTIDGTYLWHYLSYVCRGREYPEKDFTITVTLQGNTLTVWSGTGTLNSDGSFSVDHPGLDWTIRGVFATEGGHTVIRDGKSHYSWCEGTFVATKQ